MSKEKAPSTAEALEDGKNLDNWSIAKGLYRVINDKSYADIKEIAEYIKILAANFNA